MSALTRRPPLFGPGLRVALAMTVMLAQVTAYAGEPDAKDKPPAEAQSDAKDKAPTEAQPDAQEEPAAGGTAQCVASFDAAQKQRLAGKLLSARRELVRCSQPDCPEVVTGKCVQWLEQVNAAIPSVVVAARDARGRDLIDAQLYIDGTLVSERMDGTAIDLEPGPHRVEVRRRGRRKGLDVLVREGEQRRRVDVVLAEPQKQPPAPETPIEPSEADPLVLPAMSWIGFGGGAVGLVLGTATGIAAIVVGDDLQARCEQGICHPPEQEELQAGTALAHASTASFILAGVGVGLGGLGLLIGEDEDEDKDDPAAPKAPAERVALRLSLRGLSLEGRF